MSDERWIKVGPPPLGTFERDAYKHAAGQRVESIRWCETHEERALKTPGMICECCWASNDLPGECACVDATLILPPKEQA